MNNLYHLKDFEIPVGNEKSPHLLITGKNGSGKTILLKAVDKFLNKVKGDRTLDFLSYRKHANFWRDKWEKASTPEEKVKANMQTDLWVKKVEDMFGHIELEFLDVAGMVEKHSRGDFIFAFFDAHRKCDLKVPKNPTKPVINPKANTNISSTSQLLYFLSDLKIQESLARNEGETEDADRIKDWFTSFENILKQIFQDKNLKLKFNYRDYSFLILNEGKEFHLTEMSDGYTALIDIVADLIMKIQAGAGVTRTYEKEGIVLIDEIETHLHLELQKNVMPLLTALFPNIQFIVTTHSPFVLSSMKNALAYDLEHRESVDELTQYSYESLAEGYFGVTNESGYIQDQLSLMEQLLKNDNLMDSQKNDLKRMIADFEKIPSAVAPTVVGQYLELKKDYYKRFKELGV